MIINRATELLGSMLNGNGDGAFAIEVATYADLPYDPAYTGKLALVLSSTGLLWNRRRGLYRYDGVEWTRLSNVEYQVLDSEATISDDADNSKKMVFELVNISTGTTRKLIMADQDVNLGDLVVQSKTTKVTGLYTGGTITQTGASTITVSPATGQVVDYSDPANILVYPVTYAGVVDYTPTTINGSVLIGIDKDGVLTEVTTGITTANRRNYILVGAITLVGGIIVGVIHYPLNIAYQGQDVFNDFIFNVLKTVNQKGNTITFNGANLSLDTNGGYVFSRGINYRNDVTDPSSLQVDPSSPLSLYKVKYFFGQYISVDTSPITVIDPAHWDDRSGGALQDVDPWEYTIQIIYISPSDPPTYLVAYGQEKFSNMFEAQRALSEGSVDFIEVLPLDTFARLAYIIVRGNAEHLDNPSECLIIPDYRFRVFDTPQVPSLDKGYEYIAGNILTGLTESKLHIEKVDDNHINVFYGSAYIRDSDGVKRFVSWDTTLNWDVSSVVNQIPWVCYTWTDSSETTITLQLIDFLPDEDISQFEKIAILGRVWRIGGTLTASGYHACFSYDPSVGRDQAWVSKSYNMSVVVSPALDPNYFTVSQGYMFRWPVMIPFFRHHIFETNYVGYVTSIWGHKIGQAYHDDIIDDGGNDAFDIKTIADWWDNNGVLTHVPSNDFGVHAFAIYPQSSVKVWVRSQTTYDTLAQAKDALPTISFTLSEWAENMQQLPFCAYVILQEGCRNYTNTAQCYIQILTGAGGAGGGSAGGGTSPWDYTADGIEYSSGIVHVRNTLANAILDVQGHSEVDLEVQIKSEPTIGRLSFEGSKGNFLIDRTLTGTNAVTINGSTGDFTINGNLTVNGTTTTVNSTIVTVDDKNIELGSVTTPTDVTADGGGITLKGTTDKTIIWDNANDNWTLNQHVNIPTGYNFKINNVSVLNATTLGSSVVTSSLTTVGALNSGSITSGFGSINTGADTITTTGQISAGNLNVSNGSLFNSSFGDNDLTINKLTSGISYQYNTGDDKHYYYSDIDSTNIIVGKNTDNSTGLVYGCSVSIATTTTIDITAGYGLVVNYDDPDDPDVTEVNYAGVTGYTPANIGNEGFYYLALNSAGTLSEINVVSATSETFHDYIVLGAMAIFSNQIIDIDSDPSNLGYAAGTTSQDFIREVIGPATINGNIISPNGANLKLDNSGGKIFVIGCNLDVNADKPNERVIPPTVQIPFYRLYRSAAGYMIPNGTSPVTDLDPEYYDDGSGTLQPVSTYDWTVQVVYVTPNGEHVVVYGQEVYDSTSDVLAAIQNGTLNYTEIPPLDKFVRRCFIAIREGTYSLLYPGDAYLFQDGKFRAGGISSSSVSGVSIPGGIDTNIQYNNNGIFGGSNNFTWNNSTSLFSVSGASIFNAGFGDFDFTINRQTSGYGYFHDCGTNTHYWNGGIFFNYAQEDRDFHVVKFGDSQDAYMYDAGSDDHHFSGNMFFNTDYADRNFTIFKQTVGTAYQYNTGTDYHYYDGNVIFNNSYGDKEFFIRKYTAGIAYNYYTGGDQHRFSGETIFNYAQEDRDFSIRKLTSGNAYVYDAGAHQHRFSGPLYLNYEQNDEGDFLIYKTGGTSAVQFRVDVSADSIFMDAATLNFNIDGAGAFEIYDDGGLHTFRFLDANSDIVFRTFTNGVNGRFFVRQYADQDIYFGDLDANGGAVYLRSNGNDRITLTTTTEIDFNQSDLTNIQTAEIIDGQAPNLLISHAGNGYTSQPASNLHRGIGLISRAMDPSNEYTAFIQFGSDDTNFTTANPKFLAVIGGRATEVYAADTDSGMAIDFFTTPDDAGTNPIPSHAMTIGQNQFVGIGQQTPLQPLHITEADYPNIWVNRTNGGLENIPASNQPYGLLLTAGNLNTTLNKYTPMIQFGSTDPQFTTANPKWLAGIAGRAGETYGGDSDSGMFMDFFTTPDNQGGNPTPSLVMTLSDAGYLGINNPDPNQMLSINTGSASNQGIGIFGSGTPGIFIGSAYSSNSAAHIVWDSDGLSIHHYGITYGQQLFIDGNSSRVGIATADPQTDFHVNVEGTSAYTAGERGILITGGSGTTRLYLENTGAVSGDRMWGIFTGGDGTFSINSLNDSANAFTQSNIIAIDHNSGDIDVNNSMQFNDRYFSPTLPVTLNGGTYTPDYSAGNQKRYFTITASTTIENATGTSDGMELVFIIVQDATGGNSVSWGSNYMFNGGSDPSIGTGSNRGNVITFECANGKFWAKAVQTNLY